MIAALRTLSPARTASLAMAAMGVAMLSHLRIGGRPAAVAMLIVASSVFSAVAAWEVLKNDALGWTLAMGHAGLTSLGLVAALSLGIPGVRDVGWSVPSIATVACCGWALTSGVAARRGRAKRLRETTSP